MIWGVIISAIVLGITVFAVAYQSSQKEQTELLVRNDSLSRRVEFLDQSLRLKTNELNNERELYSRLKEDYDILLRNRGGLFKTLKTIVEKKPLGFEVRRMEAGRYDIVARYDENGDITACIATFDEPLNGDLNRRMAKTVLGVLIHLGVCEFYTISRTKAEEESK